MSRITPIHWKKFEKFLKFSGCEYKRTKGSHVVYSRTGLKRPIIFPKDTQIPVFVIRNNIRLLGLTPAEYIKILKEL